MMRQLGDDFDRYTLREAEFGCNTIVGFNFADGPIPFDVTWTRPTPVTTSGDSSTKPPSAVGHTNVSVPT